MRWPVPNKKPPNETIRRRLTDSRFLDHYIDLSSANGFAKTNRPAARPCVIARMPRVCAVSANVAGVSRYHQSDSQPRHRPHKIVPSHLTFSSPPADSINMTTSHAAALIVLFTAWISAPFVQAQSQGDDAPPADFEAEHDLWVQRECTRRAYFLTSYFYLLLLPLTPTSYSYLLPLRVHQECSLLRALPLTC